MSGSFAVSDDSMNTDDVLMLIKARAARNAEVRLAAAASPGMEIGAAYKKWKAARGEPVEMLLSAEINALRAEAKDALDKLQQRPCTAAGCDGTQRLESVCTGCVEGAAGYKTKWTCSKCMHRDLSKEDITAWLIKLSSS